MARATITGLLASSEDARGFASGSWDHPRRLKPLRARNYGFARARVRRLGNVQLRFGDSRSEVRRAIEMHHLALKERPLFAYLDAHWNEDLPLADELDVSECCRDG